MIIPTQMRALEARQHLLSPARGLHPTTPNKELPCLPLAQSQMCSQNQGQRAWWGSFQQRYREAQVSWQKLLESSTFTTRCSVPPQGLPKRRGASPVLAVTLRTYLPLPLIWTKKIVSISFLLKRLVFQFSLPY